MYLHLNSLLFRLLDLCASVLAHHKGILIRVDHLSMCVCNNNFTHMQCNTHSVFVLFLFITMVVNRKRQLGESEKPWSFGNVN